MKTLILLFSFFPIICMAQISPNVTKRFPAQIVIKIDEINSKLKLSEEQQMKIAKKLFTADSLANISLAKGEPVSKFKSTYNLDTHFLKSILSAEELDNYGYQLNKENRFLVALKFASELKLDSNQVSDLRMENESFDPGTKTSVEIVRFYNSRLNKILRINPYMDLLKIIYKEKSLSDAKNDWEKIIKLNLLTDEDPKNELSQVVNYHLAKNSILDAKAEKFDADKTISLLKKMTISQPSILLRAYILSNGVYIKNIYSSVIMYEKELKLNKVQIDSVVNKYRELETANADKEKGITTANPSRTALSEYENLNKILTPDQLNVWMVNKDKKLAARIAKENWNQLEVEGMNKDLDKEKTIQEFSDYHLKYLVSKEKVLVFKNPADVFLTKEIENNKPELLKELDALARSKSKREKTKNDLAW